MQNRRFGRAAAVLGLAAGAALIAGPASAEASAISSGPVVWTGVGDGGYIEDAAAAYLGLGADGFDVTGWTADAFDGFLDSMYFMASDNYVTVNPSSFSYVSGIGIWGGTTELVWDAGFSLFDPTSDDLYDYTATLTLSLEGSYARWDIDVVADVPTTDTARVIDAMEWGIRGELGSDEGTVYDQVDARSLVSHDSDGWDPIVAYHGVADTVSIEAFDEDDRPWFYMNLTAAGHAALVVSLQDYAPCARDAAIEAQVAAAASLDRTFGEALLPPATDACMTVGAADAVTEGVAFEQALPLELTEEGSSSWQVGLAEGRFAPETEDITTEFSVLDAPEGVDAEFVLDEETEEARVVLTGTVDVAGTYDVLVALYLTAGESAGLPLVYSIPLTVAPLALEAGTVEASGSAIVGGKLTAATYGWPADATLSYQWRIAGENVEGATSATWKPTAAAFGKKVSVKVTATADGRSAASKASKGVVVKAGTMTAGTVEVVRAPVVGSTVGAATAGWPKGSTKTYEWRVGGVVVAGEHGKTLEVTKAMTGKRIAVKVTAAKTGYRSVSTVSAKSARVG
ncbi:hypothetical protein [Demequina gelatinilytica]|uniref:hypothetical protein n=1 Tax=Demequina gelatinilytica TaxID=1638980 RepID=UPI000A6553FA|nr:hypothetical protein [Demequina gelatinilytica]